MARWNAVIDVSNVCWSPYLPPLGRQAPVWDRLGLVMSAWWAQHGDDAQFELVADDSLARVLGPGAREFLAFKRDGLIRTASVADGEILQLAQELGLHVITRDHYIDHRAAHPWIEQSPERFHAWDTAPDGLITLAPLGIRTRSAQDVSQAVEVKRLRHSARLDAKNPAHRKMLQTRWNCENTACRQSAQWQGQLLTWPRVSPEGAALCPSCSRPLASLGPRAALHEVVVADAVSHVEIMRFPLEVDCPVIIGRGAAVKGIDLSMYTEGARSPIDTISRQHALLRLSDAGAANWRLSVMDLNSTNGTTVERWTGGGFDQAKPVPADTETHVGTRDRLILGDAVLLRLSGKRYLAQPSSPHQADPWGGLPPDATAIVPRQRLPPRDSADTLD
jgi:hypothetical protein